METKFPDFLQYSGDLDASSSILRECLLHCTEPEEQSNILRLRSRNEWLRGNFFEALNDTLLALRVLGIEISPSPTRRQADVMFEQVKNEVMALTWEEILLIPRTTDPKIELAVTLLNDAGEYTWLCISHFKQDITYFSLQAWMLTGVLRHIFLPTSLDWRYMTILSMKELESWYISFFEDYSTSFKVNGIY